MDNQHRKIKGYGELSQADIDLMNEIKQLEASVLAIHARVAQRVGLEFEDASPEEKTRIQAAEPFRWAAIAKTDLQQGFMALLRAVAQPMPLEVSK